MTTMLQDPPQAVAALRQASRLAFRELGMLNPTVASSGCSPSECHTLIEIGRTGHLTAGELSQRLGLDKSTVSRVIGRLVTRGLVAAQDNPGDQRLKPLCLTSSGQKHLVLIDHESNAQVQAALMMLPPTQRRTVLEGMELYAKALARSRRQRELSIRPIEPQDTPAVARIIRDVMGEFGVRDALVRSPDGGVRSLGEGYSITDPEVDDMATAYSGERAAYWVITSGAKVLGGAGVGPLDGTDDDTCELRKMYLLPELRGLGMGRRLLDLCLRTAEEMGYRRCYLETLSHMAQAQALYEANGFKAADAPLGNTGHFACNRYFVKEL